MEQEFEIKAVLKIRKPTIDDGPALHLYCFPSRKLTEIENELKADLEEMERGKVIRLVVDASGYAVGNIKLSISEDDSTVGLISDIVVAGPFRGINVADKLMQVLTEVAKSKGIKTLKVQLHRNEVRAIEAFKKWGFTESEIITLERKIE